MSALRKRCEEAADAIGVDWGVEDATRRQIADAIEAEALRVARLVASQFNCEMDDSTGVMFDERRKQKIVAEAIKAAEGEE